MPEKNIKIVQALLLLAAIALPAAVFAAGEVPTMGMFASIFGEATLAQIIIRIVQFFIAILGLVFVGLLLYAGFNWLTSQGDPNKIQKAKQTIYQALIGLVIIFSAFAITAFIFDRFGPDTLAPEPCIGPDCPSPCFGPDCAILPDPYESNKPEIIYIDPALDVNGDTDYLNITTSTVDDDISNGAKGNLITIYGRYFGYKAGKVYFIDRATNARIEADISPCDNSWTSNQIIVLVPAAGITANGVAAESAVSTTNPLYNYDVIVEKNIDLNPLESLPHSFQINQIERPGICSMKPRHGIHPATTTISGIKFPVSGTQDVVWEIESNAITTHGGNWLATSTVDVIPEGIHGKALVSIYNGTVNSNFYAFMISDGKINSPCGFDTLSCRNDLDTCALNGLVCAENCTCQPPPSPDACVYNADPALNSSRACSNGGCSGRNFCASNGVYSRSCTLDNPACIPYLGKRARIASFSWSFNAFKKTGPGSSCSSDTWGDDTCDLNGCVDDKGKIDSKLYCETEAIAESPTASSSAPCTCLPKSNLCETNAKEACADVGQCKMIKTCDISGHWGECSQVNPNCIPYQLRSVSTIASYSWSFGANGGDNGKGPMVVSNCDGSIDCSKNRLPSPSPWSFEWSNAKYPGLGIENDKACLNATIHARFTKTMDPATLNTDNIKLYQVDADRETDPPTIAWFEVPASQIDSISPQASGNIGIDSFNIKMKFGTMLFPDTIYLVFLSKGIRDELGRNLIDNPADNGVKEEFCNVNINNPNNPLGSRPTSTSGVCWGFMTRSNSDPNKICDVGCVNCGPDGYFNRYYGDKQLHDAYPISLDNSCIMLNPTNYAWDWKVEEQTNHDPDNRGWLSMTSLDTAYSWLLNILGQRVSDGENGNRLDQSAGTAMTGMATTTAQIESKWRTNANYSTWFGDDDFDFFGVRAQEMASRNSGICKVHNDFTDPIVIESQYCSKSDDPAHRILQSPSPWKGQTDACLNAAVFVLFSRNMLDSSLTVDGNSRQFMIYDCGANSAAATSSALSAAAPAGCTLKDDWTAHIFNHANQGLTVDELANAPASVNNSINAEGIQIIPPSGTKLAPDSWYRIIIKGGYDGVRGGTSSPELAEGVLQVPNSNARLTDASGNNWYFWYFKTGTSTCPIDQIAVLPQAAYLPAAGEKKDYLADPYAANCNHLNPYSYIWLWDSLINPFLDRCPGVTTNSGDTVATICERGNLNCAASPNPSTTSPEVTAFSHSNGNTFITAAAEQYPACSDNKWGAGELQVGNLGFMVSQHSNTDCLNTEVSMSFSRDAASGSIWQAGNIALYRCDANNADCPANLANSINLEIKYPLGPAADPNPLYTNRVLFRPTNLLVPDTAYRVVVKGGLGGIKSSLNGALQQLNYNSTGSTGAEACDPSVYPWRSGDPEAGLCSDNCNFTGNLCGKESQECTTTISALIISNPTAYCNNQCRALGNVNLASCGNGIIEPGEDCDDNNVAGGDGCSSRCLWEGTAALCGNGRIDKGEQCDDGKNVIGDGCSDKCLYESTYAKNNNSLYKGFACGTLNKATTTVAISGQSVIVKSVCQTPGLHGCTANCLNAGSEPKAPVCGNGKIEFGEQCDDGVNNDIAGVTTKRCTNYCLLRGAVTPVVSLGTVNANQTCNNNQLDNGAFDSYSWTFKLSSDTKECRDIITAINPCSNGVWSVTADSAIDNFTTIIYKGMNANSGSCIKDSEMNKVGFWRRMFNEIVRFVKTLLGFHAVIASDWWCPVSTEIYTNDDLQMMRLGNYKRDSTVDSVNAEILGYPNDSDDYKVDYIRSANWTVNTQYKMRTLYEKNGVIGTSTASITTYPTSCVLKDVRFDIWPRGATKKSDAFFCASDPTKGKPDECGRFTSGVYDDDMSAGWTMDQPGNGYNLSADGTAQTSISSDNYRPGNNHLYRVWPLGDKAGGTNSYVLRGTDFNVNLLNVNAKTIKDTVANTNYGGDFWLTSGANPGRSFFDVTISDAADPSAGQTDKATLPIYTYFCNNPWPDAANFPFVDSNNNCTGGTGNCINTNFATYYCRDAGIEKTCVNGNPDKIGKACANDAACWDKNVPAVLGSCLGYTTDDLPSIGDYDAATDTFGDGTAVLKGSGGEDCLADSRPQDCDNKMKEFLFSGIAGSADGIGLRVYNNNNHYSPTLWYVNRFFPNLGDNLTKLAVDGYSAATEGRTAYINAADFSAGGASVYTNMYLLSHSQGAASTTANIYKQLLSNIFFNAGGEDVGGLEYETALNYCSEGAATEDNVCFSDLDCAKRNAGYCLSMKGKITRDTQRLADLQTIYTSMAGYYGKTRCSNDLARLCKTKVDCYGGGECGNFYPNLRSGTYITGKSYSVWPSWQDNLAKELGFALPVDPINKLWRTDGSKCSDPFNPITCWNQTDKAMSCDLSSDSAVYAYYGTKTGTSTKLYAKGELYSGGGNWQPAWENVANLQYNPFSGYDSNNFCTSLSDTCGNGQWDQGENCSNCPMDNACTGANSCQRSGDNWACAPINNGDDGVIQPGEECDDGNNNSNDGCTNNRLDDGYQEEFGEVVAVCGDGLQVTGEECEFSNGKPMIPIGGILTEFTDTHIGELACTSQCQLSAWYKATLGSGGTNRLSSCGDGVKTDQEACDCGNNPDITPSPYSNISLFNVYSQSKYNVFSCPSFNRTTPSAYSNESLRDYPYCDNDCYRHDGNYYYCGDGQGTNNLNHPNHWNELSPPVTDWIDWWGQDGQKCTDPLADGCTFNDTSQTWPGGDPVIFIGEECDESNPKCDNNDLCDKCTKADSGDLSVVCDPLCETSDGTGCCYKKMDGKCTADACERSYCSATATRSDCQQCLAGQSCCNSVNCSWINNGWGENNEWCGSGTPPAVDCSNMTYAHNSGWGCVCNDTFVPYTNPSPPPAQKCRCAFGSGVTSIANCEVCANKVIYNGLTDAKHGYYDENNDGLLMCKDCNSKLDNGKEIVDNPLNPPGGKICQDAAVGEESSCSGKLTCSIGVTNWYANGNGGCFSCPTGQVWNGSSVGCRKPNTSSGDTTACLQACPQCGSAETLACDGSGGCKACSALCTDSSHSVACGQTINKLDPEYNNVYNSAFNLTKAKCSTLSQYWRCDSITCNYNTDCKTTQSSSNNYCANQTSSAFDTIWEAHAANNDLFRCLDGSKMLNTAQHLILINSYDQSLNKCADVWYKKANNGVGRSSNPCSSDASGTICPVVKNSSSFSSFSVSFADYNRTICLIDERSGLKLEDDPAWGLQLSSISLTCNGKDGGETWDWEEFGLGINCTDRIKAEKISFGTKIYLKGVSGNCYGPFMINDVTDCNSARTNGTYYDVVTDSCKNAPLGDFDSCSGKPQCGAGGKNWYATGNGACFSCPTGQVWNGSSVGCRKPNTSSGDTTACLQACPQCGSAETWACDGSGGCKACSALCTDSSHSVACGQTHNKNDSKNGECMECPTDKPYDYNGSCHKCAQGQYEYVGNCELPEDIPVIPATEGIYWDCDAPADCSSSICGQVSVSCTFIPDNGHTKTVMKLCVNHTNDGCCRGSENFNNERGCNLTSSDGFRLKREGWDQWVGYKDSDSAKKVLNLRSQDASDSYNITLGEIMSMSDDTLGYKVVGTAWEEWNADYVALNGSDGNKFTSNSFVDSNNDSMSPVKRGALFRIRSTKSGYTSYWQHYTNGVIGSEFIMFDGGNEDLFFRLCTNNGCCFQDSCN